MNKRLYLILFIIPAVCFIGRGEESAAGTPSFGIQGLAGYELPLGDSVTYFESGISGGAFFKFKPDVTKLLAIAGEFEYAQNPVDDYRNLTKMTGALGLGIDFQPMPFMGLNAFALGGYYFSNLDSDEGEDPIPVNSGFISVAAGPEFYLTKAISIFIQIGYKNFLTLYQGLGASAGVSLYFGEAHRKPEVELPLRPQLLGDTVEGNLLQLNEIEFNYVFPVFYSYYDDHPVGKAVLHNPTEEPLTNISVSLLVNQYMDAPKECSTLEILEPGESVDIDMIALFTNSVLEITEGTKVASEITLAYEQGGIKYEDTINETLNMHYRNAMTWDDDRKAAAFVTAKDPSIMSFSKNTVSMIQRETSRAVDKNFQMAIALFDALTLYGMSYVIDPTTPYSDLSTQKTSVDFLQFPRETLEYKAGDCDDLSILNCALFESVGIESAFVTVPGHIFVAFALKMTPDEARRAFSRSDELIFRDEKAWVPIEITELKDGFLYAWQLGAKQWRENNSREQAGFFPVRNAWTMFQPVGLPGTGKELEIPEQEIMVENFNNQLSKFIDREIYPQVAKLEGDIEAHQDSYKFINRLGVLYARYGLNERAIEQFAQVLEVKEHAPTLLNMGNLHFLEEAMDEALEYYERAEDQAPNNPRVVLSIARVNHELENYGSVRRNYEKLKTMDPALAERFAYLDLRGEEASRAAEMSAAGDLILWEEDEE